MNSLKPIKEYLQDELDDVQKYLNVDYCTGYAQKREMLQNLLSSLESQEKYIQRIEAMKTKLIERVGRLNDEYLDIILDDGGYREKIVYLESQNKVMKEFLEYMVLTCQDCPETNTYNANECPKERCLNKQADILLNKLAESKNE